MKSIITLVVSIAAGLSLAATPRVKNVKAFQQYPWGKVCISYEVEGNVSSGTGNGAAPFIVITAKDMVTGKMVSCESEDLGLSGDTGTAAGVHKVVWDIGAQDIAINSANVVFTVAYCDEVYLVIDLSGGANASTYPMSYLYAVPSGGWTDEYKTTKLVLRRLPAGTFKRENESNVTLTKPFYMGVFEVTQKQYALVTGTNPSYFSGDTLPVEKISYNAIRGSSNGSKWPSSSAVDSSSFLGKLRARTGLDFDLPTGAQWEYACRAGTTTTYSYGNSPNGSYMWYSSNSSSKSHEVGTKMPNPWGLYDMHGNVWEWCLDWSGGLLSGGTDPKGPASGEWRRQHGGCWWDDAIYCDSSFLGSYPPSSASNECGFRLVRTLSE